MSDTTERKRERRAEQATREGKRFKPRTHPCLRELPPPPTGAAQATTAEAQLTMEEEMNRKAMEVEDCRTRMQDVMRASASLLSFYAVWLQPNQVVRLRPHYEHVLRLLPQECGLRHRLQEQTPGGLWRLCVADGPHSGKTLCFNVPPEALMP